jgi:hypothetical protein
MLHKKEAAGRFSYEWMRKRHATLFTNANEQQRHTDTQHKSGKPLHNTRATSCYTHECTERQAAIIKHVSEIRKLHKKERQAA